MMACFASLIAESGALLGKVMITDFIGEAAIAIEARRRVAIHLNCIICEGKKICRVWMFK